MLASLHLALGAERMPTLPVAVLLLLETTRTPTTHHSHARQAEIDARNAAEECRQLQGRRSAAALEWLLKRQQERKQGEQQEVHRVSKYLC